MSWAAQYSAIRSLSNAMWPPMWTRIAARGFSRSALRSKSSKDMQRSSRLQSTNSTSAPAPRAASGVAMKVFDGQRTVSPRTPANSSAASAPPAQLESPRLSSPFHSAQCRSKASSFSPSDHCSESSTSAQRSKRRPRSRWSNPIANLVASDRVLSTGTTEAPQASSAARRDGSIVRVRGLEHGADRAPSRRGSRSPRPRRRLSRRGRRRRAACRARTRRRSAAPGGRGSAHPRDLRHHLAVGLVAA